MRTFAVSPHGGCTRQSPRGASRPGGHPWSVRLSSVTPQRGAVPPHQCCSGIDAGMLQERKHARHLSLQLVKRHEHARIVPPPVVVSAYQSCTVWLIAYCRHGRRNRIVAFGAPAEDGTRLTRQYERFDAPMFARHLRKLRRKRTRSYSERTTQTSTSTGR